METLHRLAGVQDASDLSQTTHDQSRPSRSAFPEPPPIPQNTTSADAQSLHPSEASSRRISRASLPGIATKASKKSLRSNGGGKGRASKAARGEPGENAQKETLSDTQPTRPSADTREEEEAEDGEDEFPWGPAHPCFPHPNPHNISLGEGEAGKGTRVIRVKRDWLATGDLCPQYANLYPEILDPLVSDEEFRDLISSLNSLLRSTFDPFREQGMNWRAVVDLLLAALTGWLWDDFAGAQGAKQGMKTVEGVIEGWNEVMRRKGRDVVLVQVRRTGFMSLDFVVPDPGLDFVGREDVVDREGGIGPAE